MSLIKTKKPIYFYLELASRYYVCLMLNAYGLGKLFGRQFYLKGHLPPEVGSKTLDTVGSFDLAWAFMGYSYSYVFFIGLFQVIGGCLLLWGKTKLIGVAILIPILINIIVFDAVFFEGFYAALVSACLYFTLLLFVIYYNRFKIKAILDILLSSAPLLRENRLKTVTIVMIILTAFFTMDQLIQKLLRI